MCYPSLSCIVHKLVLFPIIIRSSLESHPNSRGVLSKLLVPRHEVREALDQKRQLEGSRNRETHRQRREHPDETRQGADGKSPSERPHLPTGASPVPGSPHNAVEVRLEENVEAHAQEPRERKRDVDSEVPVLVVDPRVSNVERQRPKQPYVRAKHESNPKAIKRVGDVRGRDFRLAGGIAARFHPIHVIAGGFSIHFSL
mmetsp:Transcript_30731/g.60151  ORF Transcript_30731/g.60151 Transcript_30731/m.60151 type:complete len:200 (+) Transcript_30731:69-668(+)